MYSDLTRKMEVALSSETSANIYQATLPHIPEDHNLPIVFCFTFSVLGEASYSLKTTIYKKHFPGKLRFEILLTAEREKKHGGGGYFTTWSVFQTIVSIGRAIAELLYGKCMVGSGRVLMEVGVSLDAPTKTRKTCQDSRYAGRDSN
jgi:hypothetical protein